MFFNSIRILMISISVVTISGACLVQPACADAISQLASADDEFFNSSERTLDGVGDFGPPNAEGDFGFPDDVSLKGRVEESQKKEPQRDRGLSRKDIKPGSDTDPFHTNSTKPPETILSVPESAFSDQGLQLEELPSPPSPGRLRGGICDGTGADPELAGPGNGTMDNVAPLVVPPTKTRQGRVLRKSSDMIYNMTLYTVVKSLQGDPILSFPKGSRRMIVAKRGVFTFGLGKGHTPQQGDIELQKTLPQPTGDPFKQGG